MQKSIFLEIGRLCNFRVSNEETDPKIGMYLKNRVGQVGFENFDFLVKVNHGRGPFFVVVQSRSGSTGQIRSDLYRRVKPGLVASSMMSYN